MTEVQRIGPREAAALISDEGFLYLDVRGVDEFNLGHPCGAYSLPLQELREDRVVDNPDFMPVLRACFALDTPFVVGCATGVRSLHAARRMVHAGYLRVREQRAGFDGVRDPFGRLAETGWQREGLQTSMHAQPGRSYAALLQRSEAGAAP